MNLESLSLESLLRCVDAQIAILLGWRPHVYGNSPWQMQPPGQPTNEFGVEQVRNVPYYTTKPEALLVLKQWIVDRNKPYEHYRVDALRVLYCGSMVTAEVVNWTHLDDAECYWYSSVTSVTEGIALGLAVLPEDIRNKFLPLISKLFKALLKL